MDCPFCDIGSETRVLEEREYTRVIFSNPRLMPGHLLVIPKRHVERLEELNEEERKEIFDVAIEFEERILDNIASGCDIRINYRPFQKQNGLKVNHLHIRLEPRELYDELYEKCQKYETDIYGELPEEELEEMLEKLSE